MAFLSRCFVTSSVETASFHKQEASLYVQITVYVEGVVASVFGVSGSLQFYVKSL
jgi:hypothetical protein